MPREKSDSQIFKSIAKKTGEFHESLKATEATARGRTISPNIKKAVGQVSEMTCGVNRNNQPFINIRCVCIENPDGSTEGGDVGTLFGLMHTFATRGKMTVQIATQMFYNDIKLLGVEVEETDDVETLLATAKEYFSTEKPVFVFNTGRQSGDYDPNVFVQGLAANGEPVEEKEVEEAEEEEVESECPFEVGDSVQFLYEDGEWYEGVIQEVDEEDGQCEVYSEEDEDTYPIDFENIKARD